MAYWERVHVDPDPTGLTRDDRRGGSYLRYHPDRMARAAEVLDVDTLEYASDVASAVSVVGERFRARPLPLLYATLARSEALSSSWIEGERDTPRDVMIGMLNHERAGHTAVTIARNIDMMRHALGELETASRWDHEHLHDMQHKLLPKGARGYRQSQVYIGGRSVLRASYMPPPVDEVRSYMDDLLRYVNSEGDSPLIAALLAHAQFETIHPYPDGNGRVGRAIFHGVLARGEVVNEGVIPLSVSLRNDGDGYVNALTSYRHDGDDPDARVGACSAYANRLLEHVETSIGYANRWIEKVSEIADEWAHRLGRYRKGSSIHSAADVLVQQPVVTVKYLQEQLGLTKMAANTVARNLEKAGVLEPARGKLKGSNLFQASDVLDLLDPEFLNTKPLTKHRFRLPASEPPSRGRSEQCEHWMPRAQRRCSLPHGHGGQHR